MTKTGRALLLPLLLCCGVGIGCTTSASDSEYFGKVEPPDGQVLRYVSGAEPETLDPQIGTTQPEARIYVGLYEGLTEYDARTGDVTPGLAHSWEAADGNTVFTFHLRDAQWSNGRPITAHDFVWSLRRGLAPALVADNAYMAYGILYAEGYNGAGSFARRPGGDFVMDPQNPAARFVVPADPDRRREVVTPAMEAALKGTTPVPVRAEDVGIEAVDDRTVRIRTALPIPYLPGLMAHQFFRPVPREAVERHGDAWTRPGNIIVSGAYTLETWQPYDRIILVRNPRYWDAGRVRLERITFYAIQDQITMMNLYKAGEIDAVYNHTVPAAWYDRISPLKDYMNAPEVTIEYYGFNVTRPPMNDVRVRKAFNHAIDKAALARLKRSAQPLTGFVPSGIFPGYPYPQGDGFDVARARALLAEAGYRDASGQYDPSTFPSDSIEIFYNTSETNRVTAEFVQAQWRQNLGLTVQLRNMEFRTFVRVRNNLEYRGIMRAGWVGDYMDPVTFLDLFSTPVGNNGTGWYTPEYARMLSDANRAADPATRYEMLARAERHLLDAQPMIPLLTTGSNWLKKPYVKGMYPNPITIHPWKNVYIEHDPARWD
jgi:ABC-type oligopeptide transport system substrate-binding subunit